MKVLLVVCICLGFITYSVAQNEGIFSRFKSMASLLLSGNSHPQESVKAPVLNAQDSEKLARSIEVAKNYLSSGSLKPALDALLGALETDPNNIEANSLAGATLMALNEYTSAEALLYSAVKLSAWSDYLSMANLAECLRINGDLEMAEKVAFKALKSPAADRDPSGILAYTLGNLFLSKHKYAEAADWLLSSAVKQSNNIDLWIKASTLVFPPENRDFKFAANVLSEANSRNPSNSQILVYLGIALSETGRLADGVALVEESYRLDNTNTLASSLLKTVSRV